MANPTEDAAGDAVGDLRNEPTASSMPASASADVICEEFLKVLSRKEAEQPMICQNLCLCAQFWRYQHYLLPLWEWGVTKIVCLNLGSFKNTTSNGGPFTSHHTTTTTTPNPQPHSQPTYREVIRNKTLLAQFNTRPVDRHDPLQAMLRHVAAIEVASMLKFCSSKRGIEHELVKHYFKKLSLIADLSVSGSGAGSGSVSGLAAVEGEAGDDKVRKKFAKLPHTAGYAGDADLTDVEVWLWDGEYTGEDREALGRLSGVFEVAHLPPVRVVDGDVGEVGGAVDERTMVYAVEGGFDEVRGVVMGRRPAALVWGGFGGEKESGDVLPDDTLSLLDGYVEFKLDNRRAPHTVGPSHLYIRKDIVEAAERDKIVPPYPVTFPHDYPHKHDNWYLDKLPRHGSGKVMKIADREE